MQTAEKSPPSELDFLAQFQAASAGLMKNGRKLPQSMALTQCIQEYNKTVNVKRWRVDADASKKAIVLSLAQCPKSVVDLLAAHYDAHKHTQSGPSLRSGHLVGFIDVQAQGQVLQDRSSQNNI